MEDRNGLAFSFLPWGPLTPWVNPSAGPVSPDDLPWGPAVLVVPADPPVAAVPSVMTCSGGGVRVPWSCW